MNVKKFAGLGFLSAILVIPMATFASTYDEAVDGDISGNRLAPTSLVLSEGSNVVSGFFGISPIPNLQDLDYLTVTVNPGYRLAELTLLNLVAGGANSFMGVQAGPVMTMPQIGYGSFDTVNSTDPSALLGWNHIYKLQENTNLLPSLQITGGLDAGTYTFWFNETDSSTPWSYSLDFKVAAPVPLPGALWLITSGLAALGFTTRRQVLDVQASA